MNLNEQYKLNNPKEWWREAEHKDILKKVKDSLLADFTETIIPILDRVYPDQYDIQVEKSLNRTVELLRNGYEPYKLNRIPPETSLHVIIHFPHLIVKNEEYEQIDIYDMFIRTTFKIVSRKIYLYSTTGLRQTYTKRDVLANYIFSHMCSGDTSSNPSYQGFCFGEGEINHVVSMFNVHNDPAMYEMYLYCLETYLQWESIEGNPYIRMNNVLNYKKTNVINPTVDFCVQFYEKFIAYLERKKDEEGRVLITITNRDGNLVITPDDNYHNLLVEVFTHNIDHFLNYNSHMALSCLCNFTGGAYVPIHAGYPNLSGYSIDVSQDTFYFQGEDRRYIILPDRIEEVESEENQTKKFMHPIIANYVKTRFQHTITKNSLKSYLFKRLRNTSHPFQGGRRADTLSVRQN